LLVGQPLLGGRLRDLRAVLAWLRASAEVDGSRIALWGDSFAPVNAADRVMEVPWDAPKLPDQAEPLGGLLALFGALYEDSVRAVYVRGGLASFTSILDSPFLYVPHDTVTPGALSAGDLVDVTAALTPRGVRLESLVDGRNRRVSAEGLRGAYDLARGAYGKTGPLVLSAEAASTEEWTDWVLEQTQR
jgi:hypothetical protein